MLGDWRKLDILGGRRLFREFEFEKVQGTGRMRRAMTEGDK